MIVWLRHGESTWNAAGRLQHDVAHPELTTRGRVQATEAAARLREAGLTELWSSPAVRARQTAEIIGAGLGLRVRVSELLTEQSATENAADVEHRVMQFVGRLSPTRPALVVSHGDTIAIASARLVGEHPGIIANASWIQTPSPRRLPVL